MKPTAAFSNRMVLSLLLFASIFLAPPSVMAEGILLGPVNVVSMQSGQVQSNRAVVIVDEKIVAVFEYAGSAGDQDQRPIDGRNGYLIAGLAEMHAHIPSQSQGEQRARDVLALYLANGITTARGMLGEPWHLELRGLLARQEWPGPRLITSGPSFNGRSVTSPGQAAERVREQAAAGYDFLKLHPGLEPDEFEAIANTAHELSIPFAGHVSFAVGLDAALRQHQATIDHLDGYAEAMVPEDSPLYGVAPDFFGLNLAAEMDPGRAAQLAAATALARVWNVPTQSLLENMAGERTIDDLMSRPGMRFVSESQKRGWADRISDARNGMSPTDRKRFIAARRALIMEMQAAAAGLLLGSDAPQIMNVPGYSIHEELAYLVAAGLTPLQALQSGTINVARFFGAHDRGDTSPGQFADLVLLERNPLDDISATREILGVMRAGNWYGREQLDAMLDDIESRVP
jgi:imidazolonepropionase-like amidohydrolase